MDSPPLQASLLPKSLKYKGFSLWRDGERLGKGCRWGAIFQSANFGGRPLTQDPVGQPSGVSRGSRSSGSRDARPRSRVRSRAANPRDRDLLTSPTCRLCRAARFVEVASPFSRIQKESRTRAGSVPSTLPRGVSSHCLAIKFLPIPGRREAFQKVDTIFSKTPKTNTDL